MSKPNNWYQMTSDERTAWEKQDRARDDAEYERDQAQRELESARRARRLIKEHFDIEMSDLQEQRANLLEELHEANVECRLYGRYLFFKGLTAEFEAWKKEKELEETDADE